MKYHPGKGINTYCTAGVATKKEYRWERESGAISRDGKERDAGATFCPRGANVTVTVTTGKRYPKLLSCMQDQ